MGEAGTIDRHARAMIELTSGRCFFALGIFAVGVCALGLAGCGDDGGTGAAVGADVGGGDAVAGDSSDSAAPAPGPDAAGGGDAPEPGADSRADASGDVGAVDAEEGADASDAATPGADVAPDAGPEPDVHDSHDERDDGREPDTATDRDTESDTDTADVPDTGTPIALHASLVCPAGGVAGEALTFDASGSTPALAITQYTFHFGDGSAALLTSLPIAQHVYAHPGTYEVSVEVSGAGDYGVAGCTTEITLPPEAYPVASLEAQVLTEASARLDASGSSDAQTPAEALAYRWDFDGDGDWDTEWGGVATQVHSFPAGEDALVVVEVRNAAGLTATASATLPLGDVKTVSGIIDDEVWTGVVLVTGHVTVPEGRLLHIQAGTTVLFLFVDADVDGAGDYGITVNGEIWVDGLPDARVRVAGYGELDEPARWQSVTIFGTQATGSVAFATFEHAVTGLTLGGVDSIVEGATFRRCAHEGVRVRRSSLLLDIRAVDNAGDGVFVEGHGPVLIGGAEVTDNGGRGVVFESTFDVEVEQLLEDAHVAGNAQSGIQVGRAKVELLRCWVEDNAVGIRYDAGAGGSLKASEVRGNAREGLLLLDDASPIVTGNNLRGNSVLAGAGFGVIDQQTATTAQQIAMVTGDPWAAPAGGSVRFFRWLFWTNSAGVETQGEIRANAADGPVLASSYSGGGLVEVGEPEVHTLVPRVIDTSHQHSTALTLFSAWYDTPAPTELGAYLTQGLVDATGNYWGTFGDVPERVTTSNPAWVDISGALLAPVPDAGPTGFAAK